VLPSSPGGNGVSINPRKRTSNLHQESDALFWQKWRGEKKNPIAGEGEKKSGIKVGGD